MLDQLTDDIGHIFNARPNRLYLLDAEGRVAFCDVRGHIIHPFKLAAAIRGQLRVAPEYGGLAVGS